MLHRVLILFRNDFCAGIDELNVVRRSVIDSAISVFTVFMAPSMTKKINTALEKGKTTCPFQAFYTFRFPCSGAVQWCRAFVPLKLLTPPFPFPCTRFSCVAASAADTAGHAVELLKELLWPNGVWGEAAEE